MRLTLAESEGLFDEKRAYESDGHASRLDVITIYCLREMIVKEDPVRLLRFHIEP